MAEHDGSPRETITGDEARLDETPSLVEAVEKEGGEEAASEVADGAVEAVTEDDFADIQKRAEEDLAYLDTPVNPDLPEPVYLFPEDEAVVADAVPFPESGEPDPTALAGDVEPSFGVEREEPADPQVEIADSTTAGENDASGPGETAVSAGEEPPPPASLLPPREIAAVSPPRPPSSALPVSLPQQPARVPASETEPGSGKKDTPTIARTVQATLGETVEIPLPGSGWVYLGEANEQKGLPYQRRRVSADSHVFVFRPETAGSYRLTFKKQDLVRGMDTDAVIEVIVVENGAAAVPAVIAAAEKAVPQETVVPVSRTEFASGESDPPVEPPVTAIIDEENPVVIAAMIDDAALWNRGRELEAPGANRDMKGALTAYKTLIRDYPQSEYYPGSQKRIAYIERFFVNIR